MGRVEGVAGRCAGWRGEMVASAAAEANDDDESDAGAAHFTRCCLPFPSLAVTPPRSSIKPNKPPPDDGARRRRSPGGAAAGGAQAASFWTLNGLGREMGVGAAADDNDDDDGSVNASKGAAAEARGQSAADGADAAALALVDTVRARTARDGVALLLPPPANFLNDGNATCGKVWGKRTP